ncbi:MAG: glycosyltransferase [Candidatus Accumulibacter sp.]|nr:glycosyltransferase [Accumulibacter sp.]
MTPASLDLSVVIPVYNGGKTIRRCLLSLHEALTRAGISREILVIDDASRDRSAKVVDGLTREIPGLRLLRHKKNLGCGPARNFGVAEARGEFLWFVDADDVVSVAGFAGLDFKTETSGCDVLFFRYAHVLEKNGSVLPWDDYDGRIFMACPKSGFSAEDYPAVIVSSHALWFKWFRRDSVSRAGMVFPSTYVNSDHPFTIANLCAARRMRFLDRELYVYRFDASSISRVLDERRLSFLSALECTEQWLRERGIDGGRLAAFHISKAHLLLLHFRHSGPHWESHLRGVMESYLASLDREMVLRLAENELLLPELKARLLEIHRLDPVLTSKTLALRSSLGKLWQRLRGNFTVSASQPTLS